MLQADGRNGLRTRRRRFCSSRDLGTEGAQRLSGRREAGTTRIGIPWGWESSWLGHGHGSSTAGQLVPPVINVRQIGPFADSP